jgi:hypothetical protein
VRQAGQVLTSAERLSLKEREPRGASNVHTRAEDLSLIGIKCKRPEDLSLIGESRVADCSRTGRGVCGVGRCGGATESLLLLLLLLLRPSGSSC